MMTSEATPGPAAADGRTRSWRPLVWGAALAVPLAILAAVAWPRSRPDPRLLWRGAHEALRSGDVAAAASLLGEIGRLRAPTGLDWSLKAEIAVAENRPDEALSALASIAGDDPMAAQASLLAGRIERQRNRMPAAEAHFRRAIAADPRLADAHRELIYILGMQLRRREADAEFKALARLATLTHQELFTWGLTHYTFLYNTWAHDTAVHLEAFILADPGDRYSRLSLATLLLRSPGAEGRLETILEPLPRSDPEAAALRIEWRLERGRVDEAIAMLKETPADHPRLARIRGRAAALGGDLASAIRHFQDALTEEPYDRVSLAELGKVLALKGDQVAADRCLGRAARLDEVYDLLSRVHRPDRENEPADLLRLGRACESAGLPDEARGWYLLAIDRDPLNAEAQRGLGRLRGAAPS